MPESARNSYQRLVGEPCLLVEQLLVDAKVEHIRTTVWSMGMCSLRAESYRTASHNHDFFISFHSTFFSLIGQAVL